MPDDISVREQHLFDQLDRVLSQSGRNSLLWRSIAMGLAGLLTGVISVLIPFMHETRAYVTRTEVRQMIAQAMQTYSGAERALERSVQANRADITELRQHVYKDPQ